MDHLPIRIDIGTERENVVINIWSEKERSEDGKSGTWQLHEHLVIKPPRIMDKLPPGELDPRD